MIAFNPIQTGLFGLFRQGGTGRIIPPPPTPLRYPENIIKAS